jgi:formylglycine-generating enzyme required for sulfatase activity
MTSQAYVDWLREKSGKAYRLLSESEWEFAARAAPIRRCGGKSLAPTQANSMRARPPEASKAARGQER